MHIGNNGRQISDHIIFLIKLIHACVLWNKAIEYNKPYPIYYVNERPIHHQNQSNIGILLRRRYFSHVHLWMSITDNVLCFMFIVLCWFVFFKLASEFPLV